MFKKILASVGIGAAKVDTQLETDLLTPGQTFQADIVIKGGSVAQDISGLTLALMTTVEVEDESGEHTENLALQKWEIAESLTLEPEQVEVIVFEAELHPETPVTEIDCKNNKTRVWLQTGLSIDMAVDAGDRDFLRILPTPAIEAFIDAMERCGFHLHSADVEKGYLNAPAFGSTSGCYQELEFRPGGLDRLSFSEVEVSPVPEETCTHFMLEVDRRFGGDSIMTLTVAHDELDPGLIAERIRDLLA